MLIADLVDPYGAEADDALRCATMPASPRLRPRRPLARWLAEDRTLLVRAAHRLARLRRCPVADAEDAIQTAAARAWEYGWAAASPVEALALLVRHAPRIVTDETADHATSPSPVEWTADAIEAAPDAADVSLAALRFSPDRAGALLTHLRGEATLEETGALLGGLTRERARQCRDELVTRLRRWYGPERALARTLHAARAHTATTPGAS